MNDLKVLDKCHFVLNGKEAINKVSVLVSQAIELVTNDPEFLQS